MLRQLAARLGGLQASSCSSSSSGFGLLLRAASSAPAPSVFDKMVQLTLVDLLGRRHTLRALEGQSLVDVLRGHLDTLGDDVICLTPEGRGKWEAHVKVPQELAAKVPRPLGDDARFLEEIAEPKSLDHHSRLGSQVVLDRSMDGTLIALGSLAPWKTL